MSQEGSSMKPDGVQESDSLASSPIPYLSPTSLQSLNSDLDHYHLWDFAGIDGLQFARGLVGNDVSKIAPFQSFETKLLNTPCSVLRLCEGNFRLGIQGNEAEIENLLQQNQADLRVWMKPCRRMQAIALPETIGLNLLTRLMTTKPPYRLEGLNCNCAVPARLDGTAVLVWRHLIFGNSVVELQTAAKDLENVKTKLNLEESASG